MTEWKSETNNVIEIDEDIFSKHLDVNIGKDFFKVCLKRTQFNIENYIFLQVVNSLAELDIPGHIIILLILICIFTRDGILMEKQVII